MGRSLYSGLVVIGGVGLEEELDRLYALPLNEFTSARDEIARRLRGEGERDLADEVKALRKPTVAVWLVNQLAREREVDIKRLLKAGDRAIQTLRAASLTEEGRDLLKRGRLTEELEPPGFEALVAMPTPPPRSKPRPKARPRKNPQLEKARERVKKLKAEAERADREAAAAAERLAKAEAQLEELSRRSR